MNGNVKVPDSYVETFLQKAHTEMGHPGITKLRQTLAPFYISRT